MQSVYSYIAVNNPTLATKIISDFGYARTNNSKGIAEDLRVLVLNEGDAAFDRVMDLHPDKDIILDRYSKSSKPKSKCGCGSNLAFLNASGPAVAQNNANALGSQGNTFLLAAAFMLAVAIIVKN